MNPQVNQRKKGRPLRLTHPHCYEHLTKQLELYHLHPYDVGTSVHAHENGWVVTLRYGEELKQAKEQWFEEEALTSLSPALTEFFTEAAELCQKALIADYYKMAKF